MSREKSLVGLALAILMVGAGAFAQSSSDGASSTGSSTAVGHASQGARGETEGLRTFYLQNVTDPNGMVDILTAIRNTVTPSTKIYLATEPHAIVAQTTPDQMAVIETLLHDLDRPIKTYRLTYTFTEMDGGKTVGVQHYSLVVAAGKKASMKQGSKVPVATGSYGADSAKGGDQHNASDVTTVFTYIDLGINITATLEESVDGLMLLTKTEESSVAEEKIPGFPQDPVIRQSVLEGTTHLTPGKPVVLGSIDTPGSTRHSEVEVIAELVR